MATNVNRIGTGTDSILVNALNDIEFSMESLDISDTESDISQVSDDSDQESFFGIGGAPWRLLPLTSGSFATACYDKKGRLVNLSNNEQKITFLTGHTKEVLSLARLTQSFVTGSADGSMRFWSLGGKLQGFLQEKGQPYGFYSLCAMNDTTIVSGACHLPKKFSGQWKYPMKIWDLNKMQQIGELSGHAGGISTLCKIGEDLILSASADATIRVWNLTEKSQVSSLAAHKDYIYSAAIMKENKNQFVTGSKDRTLKLWDLEKMQFIRAFEMSNNDFAHTSTIYDVDTLGISLIASASRDGYVKVWDTRTSKSLVVSLDPSDGFVYSVKFLGDTKKIIAGTSGKEAKKKQSHVYSWDLGKKI